MVCHACIKWTAQLLQNLHHAYHSSIFFLYFTCLPFIIILFISNVFVVWAVFKTILQLQQQDKKTNYLALLLNRVYFSALFYPENRQNLYEVYSFYLLFFFYNMICTNMLHYYLCLLVMSWLLCKFFVCLCIKGTKTMHFHEKLIRVKH